jgi:hypothetical protein
VSLRIYASISKGDGHHAIHHPVHRRTVQHRQERGGSGFAIRLIGTVVPSLSVIMQPDSERRWRIVASLPVVFWLGSLLWYVLIVRSSLW